VIFLVPAEVEILDLAGPLQAFSEANRSRRRYGIQLVSTRSRVESSQGLWLDSLEPLPAVREDALIVVPGMPYARTLRIDRAITRWLKAASNAGAQIASVCTGAFALGEAGLLDGRRCTTHWSRVEELQTRFPRAKVVADRLFVTDGNVMTSAGIASGIDLALAIIDRTQGPLLAAEVAREMVVYLRRDGSHGQTSIYLDYRTHMNPGIHKVQDRLTQRPSEKHSLDELSELAGMSRRSLTRTFRQVTGVSVKEFTTRVRLEVAASLLHDPTLTMDAIARQAGFESPRQLRRIWKDAHGTSPRMR
jgi:transcriptional regulator GlxA family with amidase domain